MLAEMSAADAPELIPPWTTVRNGAALETELARELGPGHPLHGVRARAIARRGDNDDVLFALERGPAPFAIVHLTWSGRVEADPAWPGFELIETLSAWRDRVSLDHEEAK